MLGEKISGQLQRSNRLVAGHRRKVIEKAVEAIASGEVVEEILHGHSGANEDWRAAHDLGVNPDDRFKRGHVDC